jgi:hypothetical protein
VRGREARNPDTQNISHQAIKKENPESRNDIKESKNEGEDLSRKAAGVSSTSTTSSISGSKYKSGNVMSSSNDKQSSTSGTSTEISRYTLREICKRAPTKQYIAVVSPAVVVAVALATQVLKQHSTHWGGSQKLSQATQALILVLLVVVRLYEEN